MDEFALVFNSLFMSSIMDKDVHIRWVWMGFVVDRDKNGEVYGTKTALAARWRVSLEQLEEALEVLSSPDPDSTSQKDDGRRIELVAPNRWRVINHEEYRSQEKYQRQKEQARLRQQAKRERDRHAESRSVTPPSVSVSNTKDIREETLHRFETFWDLYGKKVNRYKCELRWKKMTEEQQLKAIEVLPRHKKLWENTYSSDEYIPHPSTWLNGRKWEDEITDEMLNPVRKNKGFTPRGMGVAANFKPKF